MKQTVRIARSATLACLLLASGLLHAGDDGERARIDALLDDFHRAAAEADEARYLGHFAPDAVFLGTDDWERWPLPAFRKYVAQRFAGGTGWTYHPRDRHVAFAPDGSTAWFDEIVESPFVLRPVHAWVSPVESLKRGATTPEAMRTSRSRARARERRALELPSSIPSAVPISAWVNPSRSCMTNTDR